MDLELVERGLDLPALVVERRKLLGRGFGWIEKGGDEAIHLCTTLRNPLQPVLNDAHHDATTIALAVLRRGVDLAQVGAVVEVLDAGKDVGIGNSPKLIRSSPDGLLPQRVAEGIPVSQGEHARSQASQCLRGQRVLRAALVGAVLGSEEHVRSVLHQRHQADPREARLAPGGSRTTERLLVLVCRMSSYSVLLLEARVLGLNPCTQAPALPFWSGAPG